MKLVKKKKYQTLSRLRKSKFFVIGAIVISAIIITAIIAPYIAVHDPEIGQFKNSLSKPDFFSKGWSGFILGADNLGRDILTRILVGSRYSLVIAISAAFMAAIIGILLGMLAGFYKRADNIIMRFADLQMSIPNLLLVVAIVAVLGPNVFNIIIVLILTTWPQFARLIRSSVLVIREKEFISTSRILGGSDRWIMFSQILPNVITPLLVLGSQQIGYLIIVESVLSFLGIGIQPPTPSWGVMIADGRDYLSTAPWIAMGPGAILYITVLGFNFLGDGLRDALDPKMKT